MHPHLESDIVLHSKLLNTKILYDLQKNISKIHLNSFLISDFIHCVTSFYHDKYEKRGKRGEMQSVQLHYLDQIEKGFFLYLKGQRKFFI